jgi:uncharacterized protein YbaR (Trm112 family)
MTVMPDLVWRSFGQLLYEIHDEIPAMAAP